MRDVRLDGRKMSTKADAHRHIKEKMELPEYYGGNLDALYDCLMETRNVCIRLHHVGALLNAPGGVGQAFIEVFETAAEENPGLVFIRESK